MNISMAIMKKIGLAVRREWILCIILALAFVLRIVGIGYGLPLTVVGDEYPFTYAALQMFQSHTFIPAMDPESFRHILPYPPYLSYALLPFFSVLLAMKYLLFHGSMELFKASVITDLSSFFVLARFLNVVFGTLSVYLVYRIALRWFESRVAALVSAFLLATSLLHVGLSMVGRNWLPASFIFLLILYILTTPGWSKVRRYLVSSVLAGIGMGISPFCAFSTVMIAIHYLCFDVRAADQFKKDVPLFVVSLVSFAWLAIIPQLLWNSGNAFLGAVSILSSKTLVGLLMSSWSVLSLFANTESALVALFLCGLLFALILRRNVGTFVSLWFLAYAACFYFLFRFEPRFFLPLVPLMAIVGGYCVSRLWTRPVFIALVCATLFIPLLASVRLSRLAWEGDTRAHAREWVITHLGPQDKILVLATATTIPSQAEAVSALRGIDVGALRKIDAAYEVQDRQDVPYVLNNVMSITDTVAIKRLAAEASNGTYEYVLLEPGALPQFHEINDAFYPILHDKEAVARFEGLGDHMSLSQSDFSSPLFTLFSPRSLGPDIVILRIGTSTAL